MNDRNKNNNRNMDSVHCNSFHLSEDFRRLTNRKHSYPGSVNQADSLQNLCQAEMLIYFKLLLPVALLEQEKHKRDDRMHFLLIRGIKVQHCSSDSTLQTVYEIFIDLQIRSPFTASSKELFVHC